MQLRLRPRETAVSTHMEVDNASVSDVVTHVAALEQQLEKFRELARQTVEFEATVKEIPDPDKAELPSASDTDFVPRAEALHHLSGEVGGRRQQAAFHAGRVGHCQSHRGWGASVGRGTGRRVRDMLPERSESADGCAETGCNIRCRVARADCRVIPGASRIQSESRRFVRRHCSQEGSRWLRLIVWLIMTASLMPLTDARPLILKASKASKRRRLANDDDGGWFRHCLGADARLRQFAAPIAAPVAAAMGLALQNGGLEDAGSFDFPHDDWVELSRIWKNERAVGTPACEHDFVRPVATPGAQCSCSSPRCLRQLLPAPLPTYRGATW